MIFRRHVRVRCPLCLNMLDWTAAPMFVYESDTYRRLRQRDRDERMWAATLQRAHRGCSGRLWGPSPRDTSATTPQMHYLPEAFAGPDTFQLVVAMVGDTGSGKTVLLAAMVNELLKIPVQRSLGIRIRPLDIDRHRRFMDEKVAPLIDRGEQLEQTRRTTYVEFADGFLIEKNGRPGEVTSRRHAVAFFDVAGEQLALGERDAAFIQAVDALIFVIDPASISGLGSPGRRVGDRAFQMVINLLGSDSRRREYEIPAAVVMTKADRYRMREDVVDKWLHYHRDDELDLSTRHEESRDVYKLLVTRGGRQWTLPVDEFARHSMHIVSATGCDLDEQTRRFKDVVRPRRVLKPLVSLFEMAGIVEMGDVDPSRR